MPDLEGTHGGQVGVIRAQHLILAAQLGLQLLGAQLELLLHVQFLCGIGDLAAPWHRSTSAFSRSSARSSFLGHSSSCLRNPWICCTIACSPSRTARVQSCAAQLRWHTSQQR